MTINEPVDIIFSTVNVSCGKENTGMVEKSIQRPFEEHGENVETPVDPYLEIGKKLVPVTFLSIEEAKKLIANEDPRQLLLAHDERDGDGERLVCFLDPNFRLETGQGFNPRGIIWQEREVIPSSI